MCVFFFQAEDGIRDLTVTGVQTCALPIYETLDGITILKGSEVDILPDGSLDYPDDLLGQMDFVVASVHSRFTMPQTEMTARLVKAMHNPYVTMMGHLTGRLLLARDGYALDIDAIIAEAIRLGVVIELNANPH